MNSAVKPDAILIGVQKSGCTSLLNWLSQHPDVYAPPHAEDLPFFTTDLYLKGQKKLISILGKSNRKLTIISDVNNIYFDFVPQRIHQFNPNVKLFMVLRNPIERAYSAWRYAIERGLEKRSFAYAIEEEKYNYNMYPAFFMQAQKEYIRHGMYFKQIQNYLKYFSKEQIHISFLNDMKNKQEVFWGNLCDFLGLDKSATIDFKILNTTHGGTKSLILNYILNSQTLKNTVNRLLHLLPAGIIYKMLHKIYFLLTDMNKKSKEYKPMTDEVIRMLIDIYKRDVESLSKLVNIDMEEQWFSKFRTPSVE